MRLLGPCLAAALLAPAAFAADESAPDAPHEMAAGEMFMTLFKHVVPHAVAGVWFGGEEGLVSFVPPYPAGPDGEPLHVDAHGHAVAFHTPAEFEAHYEAERGGGRGFLVYNLTVMQLVAGAIALLLFGSIARARFAGAPRGRAYNVAESIVLFVRDEMVYDTLGKEAGRKYVPFFLTQFFFILFMNLLGLLPSKGWFGGTATSNLATTAGMAVTTFLCIHVMGMREHGVFKHWKNFIPHVPVFLVPLLIAIEAIGVLVKPFALTVRLFANMLGGHLVILSFFGMAYLFDSWGVAIPALGFAVGIGLLEVLVAFIQAYIFTYLSVIFVGASLHPEH